MSKIVLTINGGSSSLKFAVFDAATPIRRIAGGQAARIGGSEATLSASLADSGKTNEQPLQATDHRQAIGAVLKVLEASGSLQGLVAIGHRLVDGGPSLSQSRLVDAEVMAELRRMAPLDPSHLTSEISLIEALAEHLPGLPQVACFDTAFHHDMPRVAQLLPIPRRYLASGVRRLGFHGLSYSFLLAELARLAGPDAARGKVILAHLGNGASLAAVKDGQSVDTTMAFTPTAGLVMGTRTGDLDPGLIVHWLRSEGFSAEQLADLVNKQSGMLGVSETSSDVRDLLSRETSDERAAEAIALFCYSAKKWIGAMAAALGGVDTLVFAGGIGEHSAVVRSRICDGLEFLGVRLDENRNATAEPVISVSGSPATVRVIHTDEELVIVQEVLRVLRL